MRRTATTKPASSGLCGVVGCDAVADFETQRRVGPSTWTISLSCFDHASEVELVTMQAA